MLRLILPRPLHRGLYRVADRLRRAWWRLRRPRVHGCRVLALDDAGRVLLVRHSYGSSTWAPPGGGLKRGEDPLRAAARELAEEAGCRLDAAWEVALIEESFSGATNVVHVIAGALAGTPEADGRELVDVALFASDALPQPMSDRMRKNLPEWLTAARAGRPGSAVPAPSPPPSPKG
jgi:8-oxo-dGTP pyrophosphatase MutT (NUDIX family)